jgi:uncharacterized membrane protein
MQYGQRVDLRVRYEEGSVLSFFFTMKSLCAIRCKIISDYFFHPGGHVNITAILIIVFYFAIIIVPLVGVVRESLREISRLAAATPDKQERKKAKKA